MTAPEWVVVGTGRSGTTWLTDVLTMAGLTVGHEDWWGPEGPGRVPETHCNIFDMVGDVSLYAVPWVDEFDGGKALQVRHPLACIASMLSWRLFNDCPSHHPVAAANFFAEHWPYDSGSPMIDTCTYYCDLNEQMMAKCDLWWRAEDVPADVVAEFTGGDAKMIAVATQNVAPSAYSARIKGPNYVPVELHWRDLPPVMLDRVTSVAKSLGYS